MSTVRDLKFKDIKVGDGASFEHLIVEEDVDTFAKVSGDYSPLHVDEKYATSTQFGKRVVHGFFLGGFVSQLIGMHLPGIHALILKESLEFKKPVHIGDKIAVEGIVSRVSAATQIIEVDVQIQAGDILAVTGTVLVQVRA